MLMRMSFRCASLYMLLVAAATHNALAATHMRSTEERVSLIELYTSEGCSSCPPAEAWFNALKTDPRLWRQIVPVAFHVDYWDHLGWQDRYAKPEFTERQQDYQMTGAVRVVYTPGMIIDGREWRGWFDRQSLPSASMEKAGVLQATLDESILSAEFFPSKALKAPLILNVVLLGFGLSVDVARGENGGKKLEHDFTVLGIETFSLATGIAKFQWNVSLKPLISKSKETPRGIALWVTEAGKPRPLQATGAWLP